MKSLILLIAVSFLGGSTRTLAQRNYRRKPCKTPRSAATCIRVRGRLSAGNGTPSTRLWQVGTHHVFGIYSNEYGYRHDSVSLDNESPELHFSFEGKPAQGGWTVYGDFDVCPLEPRIETHMQAACIASATHVVTPKN
jgi:hypothetical protein